MNNKIIIILILLMTSFNAYTQTFNWNKVNKVTLTLPSDWEIDNNMDDFLNEILKFRHKIYKDFSITITYKRLINYDSSRNYADFDANVLKKKDYMIIENTVREINRIPAYEYVFRHYSTIFNSFEKDFFTMRKIYIVILKDYYSFIFNCPSLYYNEYQNILEKIIDNFVIEITR